MDDANARRLRPDDRLRAARDFVACYRGDRARSGTIMVVSRPNAVGRPRLGLTVSRKVGNAVIRNRVKRRLREAYRSDPRRSSLPARDYVVHAFPGAGAEGFQQMKQDLWRCVERVGRSPSRRSRSKRGRR